MRMPRSPVLSLGSQVLQMNKDFPEFQYTLNKDNRGKRVPTWRGYLQPFKNSPRYLIKIIYPFDSYYSKPPSVWVINPAPKENAPHRYPDKSLCLYYPKDHSWTPYLFISNTIVPWAAMWLAFYEIWLDTDVWYGPEAPHKNDERKVKELINKR